MGRLQNWEDCKIEFVTDELLRDVYVFGTTLDDWQTFLDFVRSGPCSFAYFVDNAPAVLPNEAAAIFRTRAEASVCLSVYLNSVIRVNVHFFDETEIELDIQASEIQTEAHADLLFGFLREVSRVLDKEAVLTSEGAPDDVIFRFTPSGEMQHFPALTAGQAAVRGRF